LGISDKSRVKIVGVYSGSMTVVTHIGPSTVAGDPPLTQVSQNVQASIQSGSLASSMSSGGFGSMLGASSTYNPPVSGTTSTDSSGDDSLSLGLIVGVAVGGTVVIVALIVVFVVLCRRYRSKSNETPKDIEMQDGASPTTKQVIKHSISPLSSSMTPCNRGLPE